MWITLRVGVVTALLLVVAACGTGTGPGPAPLGTAAPTASPAPSGDSLLPTAPLTPAPADGGRAMLWPFADVAAAQAWQAAFRAGGAQPWHLDSAATALGFTQGYLGFSGLDRVTSKEGGGAEAWVGVGYRVPGDGRQVTAAVLHLVRVGTEQDAPWEVVGTRDDSLTVDTPAYGAPASWPLTVGGTITGVDESLHVRVLGAAGPAGDACCTPAGGQNTRWRVQVPRQTPRTGDLTVVVATGGHVVDVERFAITAVRG
ncbi:hypothetical protein ACQEVB_28965 [Pseudonocardia sp. CA-107938]|uniref:hypothetical protein n=1 Tax=Pseudonocardia sp. CA-107938 TaxID=3240021 RepID=UPI003D8DDCD0